jgi:hypothetical protein
LRAAENEMFVKIGLVGVALPVACCAGDDGGVAVEAFGQSAKKFFAGRFRGKRFDHWLPPPAPAFFILPRG